MNIILSVLYDKLRLYYRCSKNKSHFSDHPLQSLLLYTKGPLSQKYVYVAEASELSSEDLTGMTVICAGTPGFDYKNSAFDMIIVEDAPDVKALFNRAQSIFLSLINWDDQLKHISLDTADLHKLIEESRKELNFSFIFLNRFFIPAAVSNDLSPDGKLNDKQMEMLTAILQDASIGALRKFKNARIFHNPAYNKQGLCFNIYYNEDYRGKLLAIRDGNSEISFADIYLFENVCRHVEKVYELFSASSIRLPGYIAMQRLMRAVLTGDSQYNRAEALDALQFAAWGISDNYQVLFIPFDENMPVRAEYVVTLVENRWGTTTKGAIRGVVLSDGVALVVNTSRIKKLDMNLADFLPQISDLIKKLNTKMGMSVTCSDFFSLHLYLKQAMIAIELGSQIEPQVVIYDFGKFSLDYMLLSAVGPFAPEDVVHPGLIALMNYDKENNTEFCKTLRVFIKCKYNVLQASSELYIHRSTFAARLKRIESICQIDLEDERTLLHILMSFYILEKLGRLPRY